MHDHIKKIVEDLLNLISQSISLYNSAKKESLSEIGSATLNSIIHSKENSMNSLLKEFNKIYPNFKITTYSITSETLQDLYSRINSIENKIMNSIENNLIPNIPSKNHDGIYTIAMNIKSNSESSMVKLNSVLKIRENPIQPSALYYYLINTSLHLVEAFESFEKANLTNQTTMCSEILRENRRLLLKYFNKNLVLYTTTYGDTYTSISLKYKIKLTTLMKLNGIKNPYENTLPKYLIIVI